MVIAALNLIGLSKYGGMMTHPITWQLLWLLGTHSASVCRTRGSSFAQLDLSPFHFPTAHHFCGNLSGCQTIVLNIRRQIYPLTTEGFKFGEARLKLLPSLPISLGFEDMVAFRIGVARTDYASGLMADKNLTQPVTRTRGRGPTVTRAKAPPASRGIGLRDTRHATADFRRTQQIVMSPAMIMIVEFGSGTPTTWMLSNSAV